MKAQIALALLAVGGISVAWSMFKDKQPVSNNPNPGTSDPLTPGAPNYPVNPPAPPSPGTNPGTSVPDPTFPQQYAHLVYTIFWSGQEDYTKYTLAQLRQLILQGRLHTGDWIRDSQGSPIRRSGEYGLGFDNLRHLIIDINAGYSGIYGEGERAI
jgi:hypothetical protein